MYLQEELRNLSNIPGVEPKFLVPNVFSPASELASHENTTKSEATPPCSVIIAALSPSSAAVKPVSGAHSLKTMPQQKKKIVTRKIDRHVISSRSEVPSMLSDQRRMEGEDMKMFEERSDMPVVIPPCMVQLPIFSTLEILVSFPMLSDGE